MSEADLIYTETLMQRGNENYKDKEIVILGIIFLVFKYFIKFNLQIIVELLF